MVMRECREGDEGVEGGCREGDEGVEGVGRV